MQIVVTKVLTLTSWGGGHVDKLRAEEATGKGASKICLATALEEDQPVTTLFVNKCEKRIGKARDHDVDLFQ